MEFLPRLPAVPSRSYGEARPAGRFVAVVTRKMLATNRPLVLEGTDIE